MNLFFAAASGPSPKVFQTMSEEWTQEDWDIWRAGQWASWWPSREEWFGQTTQEDQKVPLTPKRPDFPPPKKQKVEPKEEETKGPVEIPLNPQDRTQTLTPVKEEPTEEPDLDQKLAAAIAEHQVSIFAFAVNCICLILWFAFLQEQCCCGFTS